MASWNNAVWWQNILEMTLLLKVKWATFRGGAGLLDRSNIWAGLNKSCDSVVHPPAEPKCWCEADPLGVGVTPEKVMGACLLLVSPTDRAWSQGLVKALVLELAPNQTHDWLFSHKASSQIRWLTITLLSIVRPRVKGTHFFSPPQVCLPPHVEFTHRLTMFLITSEHNESKQLHYAALWYILKKMYHVSLLSSHHSVNACQRVSYSHVCYCSTNICCSVPLCSQNAFHSQLPFHMTIFISDLIWLQDGRE